MLELQANDPNSALSGAVETIGNVGQGMSETGAAAGPYGWVAALVGTVMTGVAGVYKVRQKNRTIEGQNTQYEMIKATTRSIVDAVEEVGKVKVDDGINKPTTVGDIVKKQVSTELQRHDAAMIGKAIIDGLKTQ
ncbi:MAG: hypothetical protein ACXAEN_23930, partial [Candidatus Thorarchaeota archaeon]